MPLTSILRQVAWLMCPEMCGAAAGYYPFFVYPIVFRHPGFLGKLAVGEITQTKTKTDILTQNTHFKVELDVHLFPKYLQTYYFIFMLKYSLNLHTV